MDYQNAFIRELTLENQRLRNLLKLKESAAPRIAAFGEIVLLDPIGWPIWIVAETREVQYVNKNFMVLDTRGNLVGKVAEKEGNRIKIMTILNPKSRISVITQTTRCLGILESTKSLHLGLSYLPNESTPVIGEMVVTSKLSQYYPAGVPVGTIQQSSPGKGFFREVTVQPNVNFSSLEEVVIAY